MEISVPSCRKTNSQHIALCVVKTRLNVHAHEAIRKGPCSVGINSTVRLSVIVAVHLAHEVVNVVIQVALAVAMKTIRRNVKLARSLLLAKAKTRNVGTFALMELMR